LGTSVAKLVRVGRDEALDLDYPLSCLRVEHPPVLALLGCLPVIYNGNFFLVDQRRRARMRRRWPRQKAQAAAAFKESARV
jgi:hypothetical protein